MKDPSNSPERRYHPREESIKMDKFDSNTHHVVLKHKPTGATVEGVGEDLDDLLVKLRADLSEEIDGTSD